MPVAFSSISALEVLDSRGRPTVSVRAVMSDRRAVCAGVPSGASTGTREAVELRDQDPLRYDGAGVSQAVAHVNGPIADALIGRVFDTLEQVDAELIRLDGTPDKSRVAPSRK